MDGKANGGREATQGEQDASQQETQQQGQSQVGGSETDYERQIADRDEKFASLEAQMAEAVKTKMSYEVDVAGPDF